MTDYTLKPCPFCGGEAKFIEIVDEVGDKFDAIQCQSCFIQTAGCIVKRHAIAAWNRRVGDKPEENQ